MTKKTAPTCDPGTTPQLTEFEDRLAVMSAVVLGGLLNGVANPDDSYEKTAVETAVRTSRALIQEILRG